MSFKKLPIVLLLCTVTFFYSVTGRVAVYQTKKTTVKNKITNSIAGNSIVLEFLSEEKNAVLYCSNSYTTTLLEGNYSNNILTFKIPKHIREKSGVLDWKLIVDKKILLEDNIVISPSEKKTIIESYAGPPSIIAGGKDFSMLVVIPTDAYDNPIKNNTKISMHHQFLNTIEKDTVFTDYLIGWKNIFSYDSSGRMLINAICNNVSSKEITTEVFPSNATDFKISASRVHEYADGNQITTFSTSVIKDVYGNMVSDGTHVNFIIKKRDTTFLKTSGNTINGIATAKMIHPNVSEEWNVYAYITGIAESNSILLNFKKLFHEFKVGFTKNNREIKVGPLKSFMNQLVPDGFITTCTLQKGDSIIEIKKELTINGVTKFYLQKDFYESGTYSLRIETGGNRQFFKQLVIKD